MGGRNLLGNVQEPNPEESKMCVNDSNVWILFEVVALDSQQKTVEHQLVIFAEP